MAPVLASYSQVLDAFNPDPNNAVWCMAPQPDGKILVGGSFSTITGQPYRYFARLRNDGAVDSSFNPGPNAGVGALLVLPTAKIVVGGSFTSLGTQARNHLVCLNWDGTIDSGFPAEANNNVQALAFQSDGKILVAGAFSSLGGQSRSLLGRLNPDGTLDTSFTPQISTSIPGTPSLSSVAVQPDGKILIGGYFNRVSGVARQNLARLNANGTLDAGFTPNVGGSVECLLVQPDGKILVGGGFTNLAGQSRTNIGRLNANGTLDSSFNPGADREVSSLALQTDGKILVGGWFTRLAGRTVSCIGRLNPDGLSDLGFTASATGAIGPGLFVNSIVVQDDARILIGGYFTRLNAVGRYCVGRLLNTDPAPQNLSFDGLNINWLRSGTSPEVSRTLFEASTDSINWTMLGSGTRITGGWHLAAALPPAATLRARGFTSGTDGSAWYFETSIGPPAISVPPASRTNYAGDTTGFAVLAAGSPPLSFQWLNQGEPLADSATVSGVHTETLTLRNVYGGAAGQYSVFITNASGLITSSVAALTVVDPYIIYQPTNQAAERGHDVTLVAGAFGTSPLFYQWHKNGVKLTGATAAALVLTNVQRSDIGPYDLVVSNTYGVCSSRVALLFMNCSFPDAFESQINTNYMTSVQAFALQPDGRVLAGGRFDYWGSNACAGLARLNPDGSLEKALNTFYNNNVNCLALQPDGKILVGGLFGYLAEQNRRCIGRLTEDGVIDSQFDPEGRGALGGWPYAFAVLGDGRILVGGSFTNLFGQPCNYLARLNQDGTVDSTFDPRVAGGPVNTLVVQPDGNILAGGGFLSVAGEPCTNLVRLFPEGSRDPLFNPPALGDLGAVALQADGKILVAGTFNTVAGQPCTNFARLNPNGIPDTDFNARWSTWLRPSTILSIAVQVDGRIVLGGTFYGPFTSQRSYLVRLDADGTADPAFIPDLNDQILALAQQCDGKLLVGGWFTRLGGRSQTALGRLNPVDPVEDALFLSNSIVHWSRTGELPEFSETSFQASTNGMDWIELGRGTRVPNGWELEASTLPPGAQIRGRGLVRGGSHNGSTWLQNAVFGAPVITRNPLGRTNDYGTVAVFRAGAQGSPPLSYRWQRDGIPLINSDHIDGADTPKLTITNANGGDRGVYALLVTNLLGSVSSAGSTLWVVDPLITMQPAGGWVNAGGSASLNVSVSGTRPLYYQWRKDGVGIPGANAAALVISNAQRADIGDYDAVVSNAFGVVTSSEAALAVNCSTADTFDCPANDSVNVIALQPDNEVLVGGWFTMLGGEPHGRLGRLYPSGLPDPNFHTDANGPVYSLAVQTDGKILVGGYFTTLDGQPRAKLGRLNPDGRLDPAFTPTPNDDVVSMAIQPDGKILVGGFFTNISGLFRSHIGRLEPSGTVDPAFAPVIGGGNVYAIALQSDGKILASGGFTNIEGQARNFLGRLNSDGTLDPDFNPGASSWVTSLLVQPDGKILAAGSFGSIAGRYCPSVARLNPDGTFDQTFQGSATGSVAYLTLQADGRILVAGNFSSLAGRPCRNLGRLYSDGMIDPTFNPTSDYSLRTVALQTDGRILVGGGFTNLAGQVRHYLGRLNNTEPAGEQVGYTNSTITWFRNGTAPEVCRVAFEASRDCSSWTLLGIAAAVPGGWQLDNALVGPAYCIRGWGVVPGKGSSSWLVSTHFQPHLSILIDDAFGIRTNHFGFKIAGGTGWSIVVEASTNLTEWFQVWTNSIGDGFLYFADPEAIASPSRFYRARGVPQ